MSIRVLIVEDSMASAMIMEAQINRREPDFAVRVRRSLAGALEEWDKFKPHIVLLDLNLPDSEGVDTTKKIHEFDPSCVIAMSADTSLKQESIDGGAKDFMGKIIGENATPFLKRITDLIPLCCDCFSKD